MKSQSGSLQKPKGVIQTISFHILGLYHSSKIKVVEGKSIKTFILSYRLILNFKGHERQQMVGLKCFSMINPNFWPWAQFWLPNLFVWVIRSIRFVSVWLELSIKELFDRPYNESPNHTKKKIWLRINATFM